MGDRVIQHVGLLCQIEENEDLYNFLTTWSVFCKQRIKFYRQSQLSSEDCQKFLYGANRSVLYIYIIGSNKLRQKNLTELQSDGH